MMDWDAGMLGRAGRGGQMAQAVGEGSGTSLFSRRPLGEGLVEHELWDWFGLGGIEGRSLVEEEVSPPRRRSNHRIGSLECPSSRDRRWLNV